MIKHFFSVALCFTAFSLTTAAMVAPVDYTLNASDLTISNGLITACSYNFAGNPGGTNLVIPDNLGITGIADGQIDWMDNVLPSTPFANKNIKSVQLPSALTYIGDYAFVGDFLTAITIPSGTKTIGELAFLNNDLKSVVIPSSVVTIGSKAFFDNDLLTSCTFENGSHLTYIGMYVFVYTSVTSITIPTPIVTDNNFEYWLVIDGNNTTVEGGTTMSPNEITMVAKFKHTLNDADVVVNNGVITSCTYDFSSKFITIPNTLDGQTVSGIADATSQKTAIFYGKTIMELTLPSTLVNIGKNSFNCNSIDTLIIPASVKSIGDYAFWGFSLDTVIFEKNPSIQTIGAGAFDNNQKLKMSFPTAVKTGYVFTNWIDEDDVPYSANDKILNFEKSYTAKFTADGTSIREINENLFSFYPNPATSELSINILPAVSKISIIDIDGKILFNKTTSSTTEKIDISSFDKGLYTIKIESDKEVKMEKFIKK